MIGQWEKLSNKLSVEFASGRIIHWRSGALLLSIARGSRRSSRGKLGNGGVDGVNSYSRSKTMISRDLFSVANNLGDSVAFNLESDTRCRPRLVEQLFFKRFLKTSRAEPCCSGS